MLIFLQFEHEYGNADNFVIKRDTGFFWPVYTISEQDKLETLKKHWGIIYNRIPDAEQELSTFYQHIKMTYCY